MAEGPVIDSAVVQRVARLARLQLDAEQTQGLVTDLQRIVAYIDLLEEVDTSSVDPMVHTTSESGPVRPDVAEPGLGTDVALANAPAKADGCFVVPRVVGG